MNQSIPADGDPKKFQPQRVKQDVGISPALSMANTVKDTIKTRKVAVPPLTDLMMPRWR